MKPIDLSLIPKIRKEVSESGASVFNYADAQRCSSHRNKSYAKQLVLVKGQAYVSYDDVVSLLRISKKPNKEEALKMFEELHGKRKEPLKRALVDPSRVSINPTPQAPKDDCEEKRNYLWGGVRNALWEASKCHEKLSRALEEAKRYDDECVRCGKSYKQKYEEEKRRNEELLSKSQKGGGNGDTLIFLTVEYGKAQEERLWRENHKAAIADEQGLYEPTAIGKLIGVTAQEVNRFLLENDIQHKVEPRGDNDPAYKVAKSLGEEFAVVGFHQEGNGRRFFQTRWTLKGLRYILGMYATKRMMNNNLGIN